MQQLPEDLYSEAGKLENEPSRHNVRVVLITRPRGCFARGSLGAGSGARVVIINLWPCPGIVVPVVIVVIIVIVVVIVVVVVIIGIICCFSEQ